MTNRISVLISALTVPASFIMFIVGIQQYRAGASVLWLIGGSLFVLSSVYTLVKDVRHLRTEPNA